MWQHNGDLGLGACTVPVGREDDGKRDERAVRNTWCKDASAMLGQRMGAE